MEGYKLGVQAGGQSWVLKTPMSADAIAGRERHAVYRSVLRVGSFTFGVFFIIAGAAYGWLTALTALFTLEYWLTPGLATLAIFVGIGFLLFAIYRAFEDGHTDIALPQRVTSNDVTITDIDLRHADDIWRVMTPEAKKVTEQAFVLAEKSGHERVTATHLFSAALASRAGQLFLARLGLSFADISESLRSHLALVSPGSGIQFGAEAEDALQDATALALRTHRAHVGALELLMSTYLDDPFFDELFASKGFTKKDVESVMNWLHVSDDLSGRIRVFRKAAAFKPTGSMNRAMTSVATPFLDSVCEDITALSASGRTGLLIDREVEMASVLRAAERGAGGALLVGSVGVGKQALVEGLADLMVEERVPSSLKDKRLLRLSIPHLVSAQGGRGAEERLLYALHEAGRAANVVLLFEDIHTIVGRGTGLDLSAVLAGEIRKRYFFAICTTTPEGLATVESSPLGGALDHIRVDEPEPAIAIRILEARAFNIENRHHALFTYGALKAAVELSARYVHDSVLPEKALALAEEAAVTAARNKTTEYVWIHADDVAAVVSEKTRVPVTAVTEQESDKLLHLEDQLHQRVVGQDAAVKAVSSSLRRARAELRSEHRPIASFLFLGPTGVGKTELAKATADLYFGAAAFIRFDMSEYATAESISRLIGGNGQAGLLTEAIRKQPFALLLLDELEKAHPDILNLFLQVLDDGRLTDGLGRTIDCTNLIIVATSNAGTSFIQDEVKKGTPLERITEALLATELRAAYKPEFLNRFTRVIVFAPLKKEDVVAITYLLLEDVRTRIEAKGIRFEIDDAAVHQIADLGFDPSFGARPLRRVIEDRLENQIADLILSAAAERRDAIIVESVDKIRVEKAALLR